MAMNKKFSLRTKFFIISSGLLFFGLIFFLLLILPYIGEQIKNLELEEIYKRYDLNVDIFEERISQLKYSIRNLALSPQMEVFLNSDRDTSTSYSIKNTFYTFLINHPELSTIQYIGVSGADDLGVKKISNSIMEIPTKQLSCGSDFNIYNFNSTLKYTEYISKVELGANGRYGVKIVFPIAKNSSELGGVICADVELENLLADVDKGLATSFLVSDSQGEYIKHDLQPNKTSTDTGAGNRSGVVNDYPSIANNLLTLEKGVLQVSGRNIWLRKLRLDTHDRSKDLIFIHPVYTDKILSEIANIQNYIMLIYTIITASMIGALFLLINRAMAPIILLTEELKPIAKGDFSKKIEVGSTDEIGILAHVVDTMRLRLSDIYKDLDLRVREKTMELQEKLIELESRRKEAEDSKLAMMNIAEDLEDEKDITMEEKRKVELLAKDLEKFKLATEDASDHITICDIDGRILYANKAVEKITGFPRAEILGKKAGAKETWGGQMSESFYENMWKIIKTEKRTFSEEMVNIRKDRTKFASMVTITPILNNIGEVVFFVENQRDITQEKEKEKEKAKDEAILQGVGECLVVTDTDGKIILVNRAFEKISGWSKSEALGKDMVDFLPLADSRGKVTPYKDRPLYRVLTMQKEAETYKDNSYYVLKDKRSIPVFGVVTPIILHGKLIGAVVVFRDISKEKEVDRLKDEFISIASHELRTPLTAIDGLMSMILDREFGPVPDKFIQPLNDVASSSQRLIHLVNDLLSVSRMQAGNLKYQIADFPIDERLASLGNLLKPIAEEKKIVLKVQSDSGKVVHADKERVDQVLNNLVGNALKFTSKGSVEVSVTVQGKMFKIRIADSGVGIEEKDQQKLYRKFQQLDSGVDRSQGTGLGLYISREMARAMGGDVYLESSIKGKGSIFVFSLPLSEAIEK